MSESTLEKNTVLFFSHDNDLADALSEKINDIKLNDNLVLDFIHESTHVDSFSDSDMVIYDLDLVNADLEKALNDIYLLKPKVSNKTLILIGEKEDITKAQHNLDIHPRVTRYLRKKVMPNQLLMAIKSGSNKSSSPSSIDSVDHSSGQQKSSIFKFIGIAACVILIGALGFAYAVNNKSGNAKVVLSTNADQPLLQTTKKELSENQINVEALNKQGINARALGNLYEPIQNNALHYFKQALTLDSFNSVAYKNQQEILESLRNEFPVLIENQQYQQAQAVIGALQEYQAFHHDNLEMKNTLARLRQLKRAEAQNAVAPITDNTSDVENNNSESTKTSPDTNTKPVTTNIIANNDDVTDAGTVTQKEATTTIVDLTAQQTANQVTSESSPPVKRSSPSILPPKLIKSVEANYPRRAYLFDIQGWVELNYQVDAEGKTFNITVIKQEPPKFFAKAAIEALKKWEFSPARNSVTGDSVESKVRSKTFSFVLDK